MRLPPKMTPAQIAEAQRMAREWKRLGAPGKSRSERAWDERAAPREGSFARPTEPERGRAVGYRPEHFRPIVAPRTAGVDVLRTYRTAALDASVRRKARPPRSPREEPECARKPPFYNRSPGDGDGKTPSFRWARRFRALSPSASRAQSSNGRSLPRKASSPSLRRVTPGGSAARRSRSAAEARTRFSVSRQASTMRAAAFIVSPISAISFFR